MAFEIEEIVEEILKKIDPDFEKRGSMAPVPKNMVKKYNSHKFLARWTLVAIQAIQHADDMKNFQKKIDNVR